MASLASTLSGTWTYRSFRNNPDHGDISRLLYGEGDLESLSLRHHSAAVT